MARCFTDGRVAIIQGSIGGTTFSIKPIGLRMQNRPRGSMAAKKVGATQRATLADGSVSWSRLPSSVLTLWNALASAVGWTARRAFQRVQQWKVSTQDGTLWPITPGPQTVAAKQAPRSIWGGWGIIALETTTANFIYRTLDGIHWTYDSLPVSIRASCQADSPYDGYYVLPAIDLSGIVLWRMGLSSWTVVYTGYLSGWCGCEWCEFIRKFVAVAYYGTIRAMHSDDGTAWTSDTVPELNQWRGLCHSDDLGIIVAFADSGTHRLMTSTDGITWTVRTAGSLGGWVCGCYHEAAGLFIILSIGGAYGVQVSPDGINWTSNNGLVASTWKQVTYFPDLGVAVAVRSSGDDRIKWTFDGLNWFGPDTSIQTYPSGVAYLQSRDVAVVTGTLSNHATATNSVTFAPEKTDGMPLLNPLRTLTISGPSLDSMTWTIAAVGPTGRFTITVANDAGVGEPQSWMELFVGRPVNNAQNFYRSAYTRVGLIHMALYPWTTEEIEYPYPVALTAGMRIPVKARFLGRGERYGPTVEAIVELET